MISEDFLNTEHHPLCTSEQLEEGVQLLDSMRRFRARPNDVCYNTLIAGYARIGASTKAFKLFNDVCVVFRTLNLNPKP